MSSKVKCDDLNKELDTWEFSIGKAAVISDCNTREITEYEEVLRQIGDGSLTRCNEDDRISSLCDHSLVPAFSPATP